MHDVDILEEIITCLDNENKLIPSEVLKYKKYLYNLFSTGLSLELNLNTLDWQDIELLKIDKDNRYWATIPTQEYFIEMLIICNIIILNQDKTKFRILVHNPKHILKHANKLIDVIGYEKLKEVENLPLEDLILYINSNPIIKNAYDMDKQLWINNHGK